MCVYVCVDVFVCACMYVYTCVYVCACLHVCVGVYMCTCVYHRTYVEIREQLVEPAYLLLPLEFWCENQLSDMTASLYSLNHVAGSLIFISFSDI